MNIVTAAPESGYNPRRHSDEDHDLHETQPLQANATYQGSDTSAATKLQFGDSTVKSSMADKSSSPHKSTGHLTWAFELVAAAFSVACFVGLIILLAVSRGKEQRFWLGGHITLNGLVALIATITRASVMVSVAASLSQLKWNRFASNTGLRPLVDLGRYDSASRGPWGSLNLLIRPHLGLAMIGALITVSTLAFDFFAQQVTVIEYRATPLLNGTVPGDLLRSETYDAKDINGQMTNQMPDANATAAIFNALMNPTSINPPAVQCSTGNCTWPDVSSLAVCGSCTDITDTVTYICTKGAGSSGKFIEPNCTYHIPKGNHNLSINFLNATYGDYGYDALNMYELHWLPSNNDTEDMSPSHYYNDPHLGYIKNFVVADSTFRQYSQPKVYSFALWWCVQTYRTVVQDGIQTQTIIANYSQADRLFLGSQADTEFSNITGFTPEQVNVPAGTNFSYGMGTTIAYEQKTFFQSRTGFPTDQIPGQWLYDDDWGKFLVHVQDWHDWIDRVALSMTNNVRANGLTSTPTSRYRGTTLYQSATVRVRWAWLTFPASIIIASIGLLLACMWDTRRYNMPAWKDDPLALLFCHVGDEVNDYFSDLRAAKKNMVMLDASVSPPVMRRSGRLQDDESKEMRNHDSEVTL